MTASDAGDNVPGQERSSSRRSDPVLVDNTPPKIEALELKPAGADAQQLTAQVSDALSPISDVRYSVDSSETWRLILPKDFIYDSTREMISVKITGLTPGSHVITIRATDKKIRASRLDPLRY